ncbi:MAG: FKBP-type peptidyl-prolyl cis-trans isomerase [Candidatus Latescibacteria bacterium]|nr:FKBP-type peptidyl-prolyl cis-trans isomerase [Candidatus Latescibacterota bacterium]
MKYLAVFLPAYLLLTACATPPPSLPAYLEASVDAEGYTVTSSGLRYLDLAEGTGLTPQEGQNVLVHYTGWLTTGRQFDSSHDRGQPFSFNLGKGQVIRGWEEGVATMKLGGKRKLIIPSQLGYGTRGAGDIPPDAVLIFEIELLAVR